MVLTADDLLLMGACGSGLREFRRLFPRGAAVTEPNWERAIRAFRHDELAWFLHRLGLDGEEDVPEAARLAEALLKVFESRNRRYHLSWMYPGDPIFDPLAPEMEGANCA